MCFNFMLKPAVEMLLVPDAVEPVFFVRFERNEGVDESAVCRIVLWVIVFM
jgi:hypothetical protein